MMEYPPALIMASRARTEAHTAYHAALDAWDADNRFDTSSAFAALKEANRMYDVLYTEYLKGDR